MGRTQPAAPNDRLRLARQQRGWSQSQVAESLGTNAFTVCRWERGMATPSPIFRQSLAELYGSTPAELGLVPAEPLSITPEEPPATLSSVPLPLTRLIGREHEIAAITAQFRQSTTRLVTLTGPAGVGKTRLAIEVALAVQGEYKDGVTFVSLADVREPELVANSIAQAVGLYELGTLPLEGALRLKLQGSQRLLILDNCEHLLAETARLVADLLAGCPSLHVLATSRAALHIRGEQISAVVSLATPSPQEDDLLEVVAEIPSTQLFIERVRQIAPNFALTRANAPAVAAICRYLDGLPLAIELAAAQIRALSPAALLARMERNLSALAGGPRDLPERQRSLRAALAWSYELLDSEAQRLFRSLAVFAGGCTLDALSDICLDSAASGDDIDRRLDTLFSLVDHSLVVYTDSGDTDEGEDAARFSMLEIVHLFAAELLGEAGEGDAIADAHSRYFVDLAERSEPELSGPEQGRWLARLDRESNNLRAVLRRAIDRHDVESGLRLATSVWRYWYERGHFSEGRRWLDEVIAIGEESLGKYGDTLAEDTASGDPDATPSAETLGRWAKALNEVATFAEMQGDYATATARYERSLAVRRAIGNVRGIAASLSNLAFLSRLQGNYEQAIAGFDEALVLFRQANFLRGCASALGGRGLVAVDLGEYAEAATLFAEMLRVEREIGHAHGVALALNNAGEAALWLGDYEQAETLLDESLRMRREMEHPWGTADSLAHLSQLALARGQTARASELALEALDLYASLANTAGLLEAVEEIAAIAGTQGRREIVAALVAATTMARRSKGLPLAPAALLRRDDLMNSARGAGDVGLFDQAWRRGETLTFEQAIEMARAAAKAECIDE